MAAGNSIRSLALLCTGYDLVYCSLHRREGLRRTLGWAEVGESSSGQGSIYMPASVGSLVERWRKYVDSLVERCGKSAGCAAYQAVSLALLILVNP